MSLLREIQNNAVDAKFDISTLLRKCKILAARLGSSEFKEWVERELDGYRDTKDLPLYRIIRVNSKGHFSGPFGSSLKNADIPLSCFPEEMHEFLGHSYLKESVASLQSLIDSCNSGVAQEAWNSSFVALVGMRIYEGMNCMEAWKVIPITSIVSAVNTVRNKILDFALEIESEAPDAGEAPVNSRPMAEEKVHQIYNITINGTGHNVATGSSDFSQNISNLSEQGKLFDELLLAVQSLSDSKLGIQVSATIENMRAAQGTRGFSSYYQSFMSILADHMQVLGPVVAPYLPALAALAS